MNGMEKEIVEVIPEDCVVVMSKDGMIKRVATKTFKPQRRNGKGNANISDAIIRRENMIISLLLNEEVHAYQSLKNVITVNDFKYEINKNILIIKTKKSGTAFLEFKTSSSKLFSSTCFNIPYLLLFYTFQAFYHVNFL